MRNNFASPTRLLPVVSFVIAGLCASGASMAAVDSFDAGQAARFTIVNSPRATEGPGIWTTTSINQNVFAYQSSNIHGTIGDSLQGTFLVSTEAARSNGYVRSVVVPQDNDIVGIVYRYQDPEHFSVFYSTLDFGGGPLTRIARKSGNAITILAETHTSPLQVGSPTTLGVEFQGASVTAYASDQVILSGTDAVSAGQCALFISGDAGVYFDDFGILDSFRSLSAVAVVDSFVKLSGTINCNILQVANAAVGPPDSRTTPSYAGFVSLGGALNFGFPSSPEGSVTLDLGLAQAATDGLGTDLVVWEVGSFAPNATNEDYAIYGSPDTGAPFELLGYGNGITSVDLGATGHSYIRFVRILDRSTVTYPVGDCTPGSDIDAVEVIYPHSTVTAVTGAPGLGSPVEVRVVATPNGTRTAFTLSCKDCEEQNVTLDIVDVSGRVMRTMDIARGRHVIWDGTDMWGRRVSHGIYFVRDRVASARSAVAIVF